MEQFLGKSITLYVKHLSNVLQRNTQSCVTSTVGWAAYRVSPIVLQDPHQQWQQGCCHFRTVCVFFQAHHIVLPQSQSEENVQLCKTPGFCLAPKLLSAAEFRFSHLTLHCLFFHSPGLKNMNLSPIMSLSCLGHHLIVVEHRITIGERHGSG